MSGFTFGAAPVAAASTAPALGTFSFGTPAAPAQTIAPINSTAVSVAPTQQFGTLGGGMAAPTAAVAPQQQQPLGLGLGAGTAATGTGFSFGKPAAPITTSASINFGTTTTSATAFGSTSGGGLFGKPAATNLTTALLPTTTAPAPFVGLGGIDISSTQPKAGDSKQDNVKVKETQVPDEIAKTVDALKSRIKVQKTIASDIGRTSTSKLSNVSSEIMNLQWALQEIANSIETNCNQIKLLRKETSKTMQSVEMAQRTQDTPAGLQFENTAPFQYFQNLIAKYEQDLINFRQQIALTERHMYALTNPQTVSPDDLKHGFQQINESFISLAGRLHEIHQKVEAHKEQFLNLRKYRLHDSTNVFAKIDNPDMKVDATRITAGPTPFSNITAMSSYAKSFANSTAAGDSGSTATGQNPK